MSKQIALDCRLKGQAEYEYLVDIIAVLKGKQSYHNDNIWVGKNYSIAALTRDLERIYNGWHGR